MNYTVKATMARLLDWSDPGRGNAGVQLQMALQYHNLDLRIVEQSSEEYYGRDFPHGLFEPMSTSVQRKIARSLISAAYTHPDDALLLFVLSAIAPEAGLPGLAKFLQENEAKLVTPDAIGEAIVAIQNFFLDRDDVRVRKVIRLTFLLRDVGGFIQRNMTASDEGVRNVARNAWHYYAYWRNKLNLE